MIGMTTETIVDPAPVYPRFYPCSCGAILGYAVGNYLQVYAYPPPGMRHNMARRIAASVLSGDITCPHCGKTHAWTGAILPERIRRIMEIK